MADNLVPVVRIGNTSFIFFQFGESNRSLTLQWVAVDDSKSFNRLKPMQIMLPKNGREQLMRAIALAL